MIKIEVSVVIKDKASRKYDDPCGRASVDLLAKSNDLDLITEMLKTIIQALAIQASLEYESEVLEASGEGG